MKADWELFACGLSGHVTYQPDEPDVAARVHATTASGDAWMCLRCAAFVPGAPNASGSAAQAPSVSRGALLRDTVIMRLLALDRWFHFVVLLIVGVVLLTMRHAENHLREEFARDLPALDTVLTQLGLNVADSKTLRLMDDVVTITPTTITWIAVVLLVYAFLELIEGTGLWLTRRWGEYFSVVVTSLLIPLEVYELTGRITVFRVFALVINVAAVVWLVWRKRLFGVRGGRKAYDAEREGHSLLELQPE